MPDLPALTLLARILPDGTPWATVLDGLVHAFQPIVQMRTGRCHGFEALLRGWDRFGFANPNALFDRAMADGLLPEVESALMAKAAARFGALAGATDSKLFLNVDGRLPGAAEKVAGLARRRSLNIVHEISERDTTAVGERLAAAVSLYRKSHVGIALDDFGVGFGGLKLLYEAKPDYVKIDRFFIDGIERDLRKRAIVGYLVGYAHSLGITTIAEGVETPAEVYACRDLGCDFAQGYLLGRPTVYEGSLPPTCPAAEGLNQNDRRQGSAARERVTELLERIPPLMADAPRSTLLDLFADPKTPPAVPVIGRDRTPRGLIREQDLKPYLYSRYGTDLLRNKVAGSRLDEFVVPCAVCDINTPVEQVVEAFSEDATADGVIIVEGGEYVGFLGSHALVKLVHERRLAAAADQNPLTRLPGNNAIVRHIDAMLADTDRGHMVAYLDFDNFKPFNDVAGFRQGDRAILMFSERLKVAAAGLDGFCGHVGGDDFVLLLSGVGEERALAVLRELLDRFRSDAESLYEAQDRERGWFQGKDRDGTPRRFPLLTASAVALLLPPGRGEGPGVDGVVRLMAANKAAAKADPGKLVVARG